MAKLRSKFVVPPLGFFSQAGDIKLVSPEGTFDGTVDLMRQHRISNGQPVGDPEQDLHDFTCWRAPHLCDGTSNEPSMAQKFKNYSGTVINYLKSGGALVDQVEAERRAKICASCPANQNSNLKVKGCCGKNRVKGLIEGLAEKTAQIMNHAATKNKSTSLDSKLFICTLCGCPNRTVIWVPNKTFSYSDAQRRAFKNKNSNCWKAEADRT